MIEEPVTQSHFLNPLVEAGWLLRTMPDKPTSPKQQFYAAQPIETQNNQEVH